MKILDLCWAGAAITLLFLGGGGWPSERAVLSRPLTQASLCFCRAQKDALLVRQAQLKELMERQLSVQASAEAEAEVEAQPAV